MRRLAEVVLGPVVVRRRLPVESGSGVLVVSGKVGGMRYLLKPSRQWDPDLLAIARLLVRTGDVVWDVGSNLGLFSKAAAFHAGPQGKVIAIEADSDAVALLNRSCHWHPAEHASLTVLPVAVSDRTGFLRFSIAKRARSANSIEGFGSTQTGGVAETRTVPCLTLDALLDDFPSPDLIKIDVEGAELNALRGGTRVLRDARPIVHCEVSSEASPAVTQLLKNHSYRLFDAADVARHTWGEVAEATYNTVAIPSERVEDALRCQ